MGGVTLCEEQIKQNALCSFADVEFNCNNSSYLHHVYCFALA